MGADDMGGGLRQNQIGGSREAGRPVPLVVKVDRNSGATKGCKEPGIRAGGVGMVAASDYALATTAAQVKLSELTVGIGPFVVGPVIERRIGVAHYAALSIDATGWRSAEWAHQRGLYAELHQDVAAVDARLMTLTNQLAASNPEATAAMKRVFWEGTEHWRELLKTRAGLSGTLVVTNPARQAIQRLSGS